MVLSTIKLLNRQEGNEDPALIFQHKWMFLSTLQTLPFEGHNVAYQCKRLDQSNIVCEYEVNPLTNDKCYYINPNLYRKMIKLFKNNVKCQGSLKVKVIMLHVCEKVLTLATMSVSMK